MWEIYSVGNATFLIEVFTGLARLWSTGDIYLLLSGGLVLGLIWNSLQWATNQEKAPFPAKGFILSLIFVTGLLGPQSLVDVRITSKRDLSFQEVNNVPLLPALGGWMITNTGTALADIMAQAFSVVGVNSWEALSPIQHFVGLSDVNFSGACTPNPGDPHYNVCKTFNNYLEDCYTTANLISDGSVQPIDAVLNAKPTDIMGQLKVTNPNFHTTSHLVLNKPDGERGTCPNVWSALNGVFNGSQFKRNLENKLAAQGADLSKVGVFLSQYSMQGVIPAAESSYDLANTAFFRSAFSEYFPNSDYGTQVSRAMFDTVRQRQLANASKKEYWMENAEIMQSFLEALTVFITPFLGLVLAISGQGLMAVGQYFAAWLFVQLWSVMIVLVNLYTALAMTNRFTNAVAAGESQFSLSAIDSQFATANSFIGMAGMLYTFIPAICVFVLYRGVHAMQGMAKQGMADPSINSQRLSPDTGATITNGNTAYGNQTSNLEVNSGRHINGDSLVSTSAGTFTAGSSMSDGIASGSSGLQTSSNSMAESAKKSLDSIFSNGKAQSYDFNNTAQESFTASSMAEYASAATKAITDATGMSEKEAQQLVASGAVTVGAGGALSIGGKGSGMFEMLGGKVGADLKASLGLSANASQETVASFQSNLQDAMSHSEKINSNLSRITTGSEGISFSDTAQIQHSAKQAAESSRQAQVLEQQGTMLNAMSSNSSQFSSSQNIDIAGLGKLLQGQDLGSFLSSQNPDLWKKIQNSEIDGKSGEQWLADKEQALRPERESKSVNAGGEARAMALMEYMKQNDMIDLKSNNGGVDIDKEKRDAEINRDVFGALSSSGVVNAGSAAQLYDRKMETLSQMEEVSNTVQDTKAELNGAPELMSSSDLNKATRNVINGAAGQIQTGGDKAKLGSADARSEHTNYKVEFEKEGNKLTDGPIASPDAEKNNKLNNLAAHNQDTNAALNPTFQAASQMPQVAGEALKPGGEAAFNNFVEDRVKDGADISGYRPEYAQAIEQISELSGVDMGPMNERLTSRNSDIVEEAQSMVSVLSNDSLMTNILGKNDEGTYGTGTESSKVHFDENTLNKLSEGANNLRQHLDNPKADLPAINQAIDIAEKEQGDGARTYLSAMQNLGVAHESSDNSDGKLFSSSNTEAASNLTKVLDLHELGASEGAKQYLVSEVTGGTELTGGHFITKGNDADTRQDYINKLDNMKDMADQMGNLLTPEQQSYVQDFITSAEHRIDADTGGNAGQNIGGEAPTIMTRWPSPAQASEPPAQVAQASEPPAQVAQANEQPAQVAQASEPPAQVAQANEQPAQVAQASEPPAQVAQASEQTALFTNAYVGGRG
jgi:hypothetical protein